jgi:STE24 endopeptidase
VTRASLAKAALDPERQERARRYDWLSRRLLFLDLGTAFFFLLSLLFTGASAALACWLSFPLPWAAALYLLILVVGYGVIMGPVSYYEDFVLPRRYGLSNQNLSGWLRDRARALALGLLFCLSLVIVIYWLMDCLPSLWWLATGLIVFLVSLLLTWLTPTVLLPLFFKLKPLEDGEMKERLANLAKTAGIDIKRVLVMNLSSKSTTANALLAGWGGSRRIILSDTLLRGYSADEIEVTLAHELGHHVHHDFAKLMSIHALALLLAFYCADLALRAGVVLLSFQRMNDLAALPWLVLILAMLVLFLQPLLNWYNRRTELESDRAALELSNKPQAFVSLMTKLTDQNLQQAEPSRLTKLLFHNHPSYRERVKVASDYIDVGTEGA